MLALLVALLVAAPSNTLWQGESWEARRVGDLVVSIDHNFLHVSAIDIATGKRRWKTKVQDKASGSFVLQAIEPTERSEGGETSMGGVGHRPTPIGGRLFFWMGPRLVELDPKTGAVLARGDVVHNRRGCVLAVHGAMAAASCEQGLWLLPIGKGKPGRIAIGTYFGASEIHMYDDGLGEPHSTHWVASARSLVGVAGDLTLVAVEDERDDTRQLFSRKAVMKAVDATGNERWRTGALVAQGLTEAGLSADGKVAWVLSESGRQVGAIDTRDGRLVWQATPKSDQSPFNGDIIGCVGGCRAGARVMLLMDDELSERDLVTGQVAWRAPAGGAERVVALGGDDEPLVYPGSKPMKVALAGNGHSVTIDVPIGGRVLRDGAGVVVAWSGRMATYDGDARLISEVVGPQSIWRVAPAAVSGWTDQVTVVMRRDGTVMTGLAKDTHVIDSVGDVLVVMTPAVDRTAGVLSLLRL